MAIRKGNIGDRQGLLELYRRVAARPGTLARRAEELDEAWVRGVTEAAASRGVWLVDGEPGALCASIHASRPVPKDFQHVLGELTLVVDPGSQGRGLGSSLFTGFLRHVEREEPGILRIELITRETNTRARRIYEHLGFVEEGRLRRRVLHADGSFEDDLYYAWHRP